MNGLRVWWTRLLGFLRRNPVDQFDKEIEAHTELLQAAYIERGMTEAEARHAALRDLGNVTRLRQEYREQKGLPLIEAFWQDLKYALRTLRRNAAFTVSSITTLGVGLGAIDRGALRRFRTSLETPALSEPPALDHTQRGRSAKRIVAVLRTRATGCETAVNVALLYRRISERGLGINRLRRTRSDFGRPRHAVIFLDVRSGAHRRARVSRSERQRGNKPRALET